MGVEIPRFVRLVDALPEVRRAASTRYTTFAVHGTRFGYLWPRTRTVGLKQTLSEQRALVAERPDVFEVQFTAGGFGWVVVYLEKIDLDELSELVLEAWRLSAPDRLRAGAPTPAELVEGRRAPPGSRRPGAVAEPAPPRRRSPSRRHGSGPATSADSPSGRSVPERRA